MKCKHFKQPGNIDSECGDYDTLWADFDEHLEGLEIDTKVWRKIQTFFLCFFIIIFVMQEWQRVKDRGIQERQAVALEQIAKKMNATSVKVNPDGTYEVRNYR